MSQATQAQILTDLQKIYSHIAEGADRLDALTRRVEDIRKVYGDRLDLHVDRYKALERRVEVLEKIVASLEKRNEWVVSTYEKNRTPAPVLVQHDESTVEWIAPPEAGKRWTLHTDLKGTPTTVCYDSVGCPVPKHVEVVPAADLDAARESLDAARQVSVNLRDRLEAAEAREKEPPYCCDLLECPTHGFAIKEKE